LLATHPDLFGEARVRYVETVHESIALNGQPGPCVIISASGMCEGGRSLHHLKLIFNSEKPHLLTKS
jgi:metallo-beta-lactamase family protein